MSRSDQSRPSKRLKHAHTATNGKELPNGIGALLDSTSGLDSSKKVKAKLSNDKIKNSRIAQLDDSRTIVQSNGDVEMQDQAADIIEISSDARSSADNLADGEEEDEEVEINDVLQDHELDTDRRRSKKTDAINAGQNGALHQLQSIKSQKRGKRAREEDAVNGRNDNDDHGEVRETSQSALQDTNDSDKDGMDEEPTFGELLRAQAPTEPIDVTSAFATGENNNNSLGNRIDHDATTTTSTRNNYNGPITANSLGTVLTQALRTNDNDLLESCLGLTDYAGVRATIERLPSHLATTLLLRLAERLHRRPGRAGNLMIWVQWSLVAHGGYLASQTETVAKLSILRRVVRERADGLQPLLRLKGKLDMLAAQLELRKKMKQSRPERGMGADDNDDDEDDDDEGIIYVEGAEKEEEDDDDDYEDNIIVNDEDELPKPSKRKAKKKKASSKDMTSNPASTTKAEESSSEIDAMPTTTSLASDIRHGSNIAQDDDDEEEEDEEEDSPDENLVDDEAEETDRDTGDDDDDDDLSDGSDLDGFIDDGEDLDDEDEEEEDDDE